MTQYWLNSKQYLVIMKTPTIDLKLQNWNVAGRGRKNNEEIQNNNKNYLKILLF